MSECVRVKEGLFGVERETETESDEVTRDEGASVLNHRAGEGERTSAVKFPVSTVENEVESLELVAKRCGHREGHGVCVPLRGTLQQREQNHGVPQQQLWTPTSAHGRCGGGGCRFRRRALATRLLRTFPMRSFFSLDTSLRELRISGMSEVTRPTLVLTLPEALRGDMVEAPLSCTPARLRCAHFLLVVRLSSFDFFISSACAAVPYRQRPTASGRPIDHLPMSVQRRKLQRKQIYDDCVAFVTLCYCLL